MSFLILGLAAEQGMDAGIAVLRRQGEHLPPVMQHAEAAAGPGQGQAALQGPASELEQALREGASIVGGIDTAGIDSTNIVDTLQRVTED